MRQGGGVGPRQFRAYVQIGHVALSPDTQHDGELLSDAPHRRRLKLADDGTHDLGADSLRPIDHDLRRLAQPVPGVTP